MEKAYTFNVFDHIILITADQDGLGAPRIFSARRSPDNEPVTVYGFGTTEGDAIVDLFRTLRNQFRPIGQRKGL